MAANGRSGGMAFWWRKSSLNVVDVCMARHILTCRCQSNQGDLEWYITCVYGPCVASARTELLEDLHAAHQMVQEKPWLRGGDFNCTLTSGDRPNGSIGSEATAFQLVLQNLGLTNFPANGVEFTWQNGITLSCWRDSNFPRSWAWKDPFLITHQLYGIVGKMPMWVLISNSKSWFRG
jgi:hypothetical protein